MEHRLGLATRIQISVCKSPFPSAGTAVRSVPVPCKNGSAETTVAYDFPICLAAKKLETFSVQQTDSLP